MKKAVWAVIAAFLLAQLAVADVVGPAVRVPFGGGGSGGSSTQIISKGGTLITPTGAVDVMVWRAPTACTVTKIQGNMVSGTSGAVNARKNGTDALLASDLAITAGSWTSTATIQNASFAVNDYLEIRIISLVGSPSTVTIQVDCTP